MEHFLPLSVRLPKLLRNIEHYDVICMQEVQESVIESLRKALPNHEFCFVPHKATLWVPHDGSVHGNAVLINRAIAVDGSIETHPMELSDDGNTGVSTSCLLLNGRKLTVWSSHLECEGDYNTITDTEEAALRAEQMKRLLTLANHLSGDDIVIWGGDFNAPSSNAEFVHMFEAGFSDLTSDVINLRTEFDDNMDLYDEPIDVVAGRGDFVKQHVHAFKRPPKSCVTVKQKVAFLLAEHGSDHLPVGVSLLI